jgi:hypothetical protein
MNHVCPYIPTVAQIAALVRELNPYLVAMVLCPAAIVLLLMFWRIRWVCTNAVWVGEIRMNTAGAQFWRWVIALSLFGFAVLYLEFVYRGNYFPGDVTAVLALLYAALILPPFLWFWCFAELYYRYVAYNRASRFYDRICFYIVAALPVLFFFTAVAYAASYVVCRGFPVWH